MTLHQDEKSNDNERFKQQGCGSGCGCHGAPEPKIQEQAPVEEDYKDKYLRLLAENENLRRRLQRESQEAIRFGTQKIILDLLDPYDHFEKALFHASHSPSEEVRNWGIGFKMIHQQFKEWLTSQGVHSYPAKGQPFNAELHEAVEVKPCIEEPEGTVIEELFKGYKMHDRVLRHAKVIIAGKAEDHSQAISDAESELGSDELNNPSSH